VIGTAIASTAGQAHEGNAAWATVVQVSLVLLWPALSIWFLSRHHDDPEDPGGDGGSGGGPPKSPEPDGPAWWPEFEREFAAHVAAVGTLEQPSPKSKESPAFAGLS
jgi:hypothetical protein